MDKKNPDKPDKEEQPFNRLTMPPRKFIGPDGDDRDLCKGKCNDATFEEKGWWCFYCQGDYFFSQTRADYLCIREGQPLGRLHIFDCYGNGCQCSLEDGEGLHCIDCSGKAIGEFEITEPPFDPTCDPPRKIIRCNGMKCRHELAYSETGIWCVSCWNSFCKSTEFLRLLKNRFQSTDRKWDETNVTNDFPRDWDD